MPTLVTFDFSKYDIANVRIRRSIFDSATKAAIEIKAAGAQAPCNPPTPCNPPSMSQMSIRETRMGADVIVDDDGTGPLLPHGGNGIFVSIGSDTAGVQSPAYIKALDISDNLFIGKQGTNGYFVRIDSDTPGRIRAARVVGNTFGEAIATAQGRMPAAVWLGADNIMVSGNILHNARESDAAAPVRVDDLVRTTRAGLLNAVLIGNSSSVPLGFGFLDEAAGALGPGKQNLANTGQILSFVQDAQLAAEQVPAVTTAQDLAGLSFPVKANTNYRVTGTFVWSATAGNGAGFGFNLPVAPTSFVATCRNTSDRSGTAPTTPTFYSSRARNLFYVQPTVDAADQPLLATCTALIRTAGATILAGRVKASAASAVKVRLGTTMTLEELP